MRLFRVELQRFLNRRITWIGTGLFALLFIIGIAIAFTQASADPPDPNAAPSVDNGCVSFMTDERDSGNSDFAELSDDCLLYTSPSPRDS